MELIKVNVFSKNRRLEYVFPGQKTTYLSNDSVLQDDQKDSIPEEFLNSLTPSGMPDHELELKLGAPVM